MPPYKEHDCCICHTTSPPDFPKGYKSLCTRCQRDGHTIVPPTPKCATCNEDDPFLFYPYRISICKKCYYLKSKAKRSTPKRKPKIAIND